MFRVVRDHLPPDRVVSVVRTCPFDSRGVVRRFLNIVAAGQEQDADVNHITGDVQYLAFLLDSDRTILTIPDGTVLRRLEGFRRRLVEEFWFRKPERMSAVVTTISYAARTDLCDLLDWPADRLRVVPVAISPRYRPFPRRAFDGRVRLLQVGTAPNKNIPRLAQALAGLPIQLMVIGTLEPDLHLLLRQAGFPWVSVTNLTEDQMVEAYADSDLVVFPSTNEGFGMPILEAQTVERPILTSNCSSMPEVAGKGAYFVDPYSIESIRKGVLALLESERLRDELVGEGRTNRQRYRPQAVAQSYLAIYEEVAGRRHSGKKGVT